ncbi:hypothetical protein [Flavobacterium selenitireducens]|uniref:hypothetical protein n=1 Tax=Flavobacterium selenitireducens TaxID=2722704 RepID=UPI00168B713D|nr:hypothetical protein [Flavobacterium selenitireducens]MBD3581322.1 hypothetical protein [Flavobacterium selenitireducens]
MKHILIMLSIFSVSLLYSQDGIGELPDYTPPSPEAAAMTKYADLTPNEFSGKVNYNLPLYTVQASHLKLPIGLNYSGAGVKVNDTPTWVGINWTLEAGGVITRAVKDKPDEMATFRVVWNDAVLEGYTLDGIIEDGSTKADELQDLAYGSQYDSEVDIFQFSFPGYSGSFFFDAQWNPQVLNKQSHLKIEATAPFAQTHEITITTPEGIRYVFGGLNYIESTRRIYDSGPSFSAGPSEGVSAFYLKYAIHPIKGTLQFEYISIGTETNIKTQQIQNLRKRMLYDGGNQACTGDGGACAPQCLNSSSGHDTFTTTWVTTKITGAKYLSKIISLDNSETATFISESVNSPYFKRRLLNIEVSRSGQIFKTIHFSYTANSDSRFFLKNVEFDKGMDIPDSVTGRRNQLFKFEYKNPSSLPARFSYSQDYAGYYNGKSNNTLIPDSNSMNPFDVHNLADRSPDFEYASIGALTDIYYPTGGSTHFDYQAKKARKKVYSRKHMYAIRNMDEVYPEIVQPNILSDTYPHPSEIGEEPDVPIQVFETSPITFFIKLVGHGYTSYINRDYATFRLRDMVTNQVLFTTSIHLPNPVPMNSENPIIQETSATYPCQQGVAYRAEITINDDQTINPLPLEAYVHFDNFDGYVAVDDVGVYLERQTDYASTNQPENIKRYYYGAINQITPSLAELPIWKPERYQKISKEIYNYICNGNSCCYSTTAINMLEFYTVFYNLSSDFVDSSGNTNLDFFPVVTTSYGGDNFENGGTEKTFSFFSNYGDINIPVAAISSTFNLYRSLMESHISHDVSIPNARNGSLLAEKVFRKQDGVLAKISEIRNTYTYQEDFRVINFIAKQIFNLTFMATGTNMGNTISNYATAAYPVESIRAELASKETLQYIDPVPLTATDETGYRKISNLEIYTYGEFVGLPTKITQSTSDSGINLETRSFYVNAAASGSLPGLSNLTFYSALLQRNVISTPVQTESWKGGTLLSRQRTIYRSFQVGSSTVYLPGYLQIANRTGILENTIEFVNYDGNGNLSHLRQWSGPNLRYAYNSRNQVVLKVENWTGIAPVAYSAYTPIGTPKDCAAQQAYPNALVTRYYYNNLGQLHMIVDPKCQSTKYRYNSLNQLDKILDDEDNILQTFDTSFKYFHP